MPTPPLPPGFQLDGPPAAAPQPRLNFVPFPKTPTPQTSDQAANTRATTAVRQAQVPQVQASTALTNARIDALRNPPPTAAVKQQQLQQSRGALTVGDSVRQMASNYMTLMRMGAAVNAEDPMGSRFVNSARAMLPDFAGNVVDPRAQRVRDVIAAGGPMIVNAIRRATGMGAKGMDSNQELKTYLGMVGDPGQDVVGNLARIDAIDRRYGTGGKALEGLLPSALLTRVRKLSEGFTGQLPSPTDIPPDPGTVRVHPNGSRELWDGSAWKPQPAGAQ
jgi:hypothetical protein